MTKSYTTYTQVGGDRFQWASIPAPTRIPSQRTLLYTHNVDEFEGVTMVCIGSSDADHSYRLPAAALLDPLLFTWLANLSALKDVYQDYHMIPDSQKGHGEQWIYYRMSPELAGDVGWWMRGDVLAELTSVVVSICGPKAGPRMHAAVLEQLLRLCADENSMTLLIMARRIIIKSALTFSAVNHSYDTSSTTGYRAVWSSFESTWKPRCDATRWSLVKSALLCDIADIAAGLSITASLRAFKINSTYFVFTGLTYANSAREDFSLFEDLGDWAAITDMKKKLQKDLRDMAGKDPTRTGLTDSGNPADDRRVPVSWPPKGISNGDLVVPFDDEPIPGGGGWEDITDGYDPGGPSQRTLKSDLDDLIPDVQVADKLDAPVKFVSAYPPTQRFGRAELFAHMIWAWGSSLDGASLEAYFAGVEAGTYNPPQTLDTATYEMLQSRYAITFEQAYDGEEASKYVKFGWRTIASTERVEGTAYFRWEELGRTLISTYGVENILEEAGGQKGVQLTRRIRVASCSWFTLYIPEGTIIYVDENNNVLPKHGQSAKVFGSCLEIVTPEGAHYLFDPKEHYRLLCEDASAYKSEVQEFTDRSTKDPADNGSNDPKSMGVEDWPWWWKWVFILLLVLLLLRDNNTVSITNSNPT